MNIFLVACISLLAGILQTVSGFGAAILMMSVLPFFPSLGFDIGTAPALVTAITIGLSFPLAIRFRRNIDLKTGVTPTVFYLAASLLIIPFTRSLDLHVLTIVFGSFLILLAVWMYFFSEKASMKSSFPLAMAVGLISGTTAALFGIGGPLIALYFISSTENKETYLANTQFLFAVTGIANTAMRAVNGIYTIDLIPLTAAGIAGITAGKLVGLKFLSKIDPGRLKRIIYIFVALAGIITVFTS